ncbi:MAG: hypothetical protein KUG65_08855 [Sphingomonadaceae bacterium]|nr:hypothetical protein [Sphingomonadaceae bacterium]
MTYFEPCVDRARCLRSAMERSLWASVRMALAEREVSIPAGEGSADSTPGHAGPLDFGAYFDLVLTPPDLAELPLAVKEEAAGYLAARLGQSDGESPRASASAPIILNLSTKHYSVEQITRLTRWWDIEPANFMGLTSLSGPEFSAASALLETALEKLRLASPVLHGEVEAIIGDIILAQPDGTQLLEFGGASSFALWGTFTVNAQDHDCWEQYFRTVVHETAHNVLFAIAREEPLVTDDPQERHNSPLREDVRPMDGIYHAAFVSARECLAFDSLLCRHEAEPCLSDREAGFMVGLLEASVTAFWECEETLRGGAQLTALGKAILDECAAYMRANFLLEPA